MEREIILNGFRIGEYSLNNEEFYKVFDQKYSDGMNYVSISTNQAKEPIKQQDFIDWAKFLVERNIYFSFTGGGSRPPAGFTEETVRKMKEIAGEYFLSYELSELGSAYSCVAEGYRHNPEAEYKDLQDAKDTFVNRVKGYLTENTMGGILDTSVVEATSLISYICEAGCSFPTVEIWPGDVETSVAVARGTASAYNCDRWGTYIAHEWYGGMKCDDLKEKRFKMSYDYCYLSGGNYFMNESGDESAGSHMDFSQNYSDIEVGNDEAMVCRAEFGYDHPICKNYRKVMADFAKFALDDVRPKGGPRVRVAFVQGNLDGWSFLRFGSRMWRAHRQEEYSYGAPEYAWRILDAIKGKRSWCDVHNYGNVDFSGAPGYGLYDIIPATVGADIFAKYDYLIFVGWNSMTQEIYNNLKAFVKQGGRLFMTAAHLNTAIKRDGSISLINNGDVSELFGCILDAENSIKRDDGSKFNQSIVPEFTYPAAHFEASDPYFAEGFINYADAKLTSGVAAARLSDTFANDDIDSMPISLVENKCGEGFAVLMTNLEYPYGAAVPMYQTIVREILNASHRTADIKVYGNDSLRFSVYQDDKVYLLNTDFDFKMNVIIDYGTYKREVTLEPCELIAVEKK